MNEETYRKLASIVSRPEWDNFLVYITNLNAEAHIELERCSPDGLKSIQGKVSVYKDLLTLKQTVSIIVNGK